MALIRNNDGLKTSRYSIKTALERRGVTASGRRIGNIMREQGMTGAYTRRRFKPHGTRPTRPGSRTCRTADPTATPRTRVRRVARRMYV